MNNQMVLKENGRNFFFFLNEKKTMKWEVTVAI